MLTPISRHFSWLLVLLFTVAGQAQDLQIKKSITVGGTLSPVQIRPSKGRGSGL